MPYCDAFLALMAVVQKRFGIHPLIEGPGRPVHPKTTTFCPILGFTPSTQPSRAHQSQNDLEQSTSAVGTGHSLADEHPDSVVASSCSKTFGESTPHREAYRAHSSPNSPISPRLVKTPPLEGSAGHIVHQTIWNKAPQQLPQGTLAVGRRQMAVEQGHPAVAHGTPVVEQRFLAMAIAEKAPNTPPK